MPHERRPLILIPLAALLAVAPLILRGCSCGHDFDFHLINWFEAARQITHGTLHPHWAVTPAWNAGEPRFIFYPPLSWLAGALLGLLMPWTWTPAAYTWLTLTAAGFALYSIARSYASTNASLMAAAVYLANPYTLYTAYERTAYAELLAAVWLPLALHAVLKRRVTIPALAIPVALLWLTNAPAAVMGCYAMGLVVLIRICISTTSSGASGLASETRDKRAIAPAQSRASLALNSFTGTLLGLGLSSFYLIPAAWERRFVQINFAILPGLRPQDNFLFHHTTDPDHDAVLHLASIVAVVLIVLTATTLLLLARANRNRSGEQMGAPFMRSLSGGSRKSSHADIPLALIPLAVIIVFMLTPLSAPLWAHLPELRFLQFPWRLLGVLAVVFALALAQVLSPLALHPTRAIVTALLAVAILTLPADHFFRQRCYPEDTVPARLAVFRSANPGTDPTDEYTPVGADNDSANQQNPGYWLAPIASAPAPVTSIPAAAPHRLDLSPAAPSTLILNLRSYPAWRITRNGLPLTARLPRKDGLIAIPLPAGTAHLEIDYATLPDQQLGYAITLFSLFVLDAFFLSSRKHAAQT